MTKLFKYLFLASFFTLLACGSSDIDKDGIPNDIDQCPEAAEDKDQFEDNDGCPDFDNDKDGVPDVNDRCPFIEEDRDTFEDEDGCPDKDNDKDGNPDNKDNCPLEAEDQDNFQDADGCPDPDNDGDQILDVQDQCPLDPEDMDGYKDTDGCPELDNDNDGIKDKSDKCPEQAETFNGRDDDDGCPDASSPPLDAKTELNIYFITGTSELTYEDKQKLDVEIVSKLIAHQNHMVFVQVFMPKVEMDIVTYIDLLNDRSKSLATYLEEKGVANEQIKIRRVTEDLYYDYEGTANDFNASRQVIFTRKDIQK